MKLLTMSLVLVFQIIQSNGNETPTYTTEYDSMDIKQVISNDRLLKSYINCLLDKGPCTPDGRELQKNLPDAIENDCDKCSARQRQNADSLIQFMIDNKPEDWAKLEMKYDANGSYKSKYLLTKENSTKLEAN